MALSNPCCYKERKTMKKIKVNLNFSSCFLSVCLYLFIIGDSTPPTRVQNNNNSFGMMKVHAYTTTSRTKFPTKFPYPGVTSTSSLRITNSKIRGNNNYNGNSQRESIVSYASSTKDITIEDLSNSHFNEFKPETMTLTKSMIFFTKYLVQQLQEDRIKRHISNKNKKHILSKFRRSVSIDKYNQSLVQRLEAEIKQEEEEKKPLSETLKTLNNARKEMTALVGYDTALLLPCFGFAGLAAFMNSVIPHYYGLCINCLANAATTTQHDVMRAITGLAGASFMCALFTGIRGALFWLAGK